jgi:ABC-type transporter Mla subunit MlaD
MCINSVDVLAQKRKTADDLVNEFAASLDSLPNKKTQLSALVDKASRTIMEVQFMTPYSLKTTKTI